MLDNPRKLDLLRFLVIGILILACIWLEYYFYFILGIHIVYTHLFYVPIVLAALWWGLKGGLLVSLLLALLHIAPSLPNTELSILSRGLVFILVGSVVGIVSDMHKRAEEALRRSRQLLRKTLDSLQDAVFVLQDGVFILDAAMVEIIDCNPAASKLFGYSRDEMVGRAPTFLHVDEVRLEKFRKHLSSAVEKEGFLHQFEFGMKRKDGFIFPVEHSVIPLVDELGKPTGWVSVMRDITERKKAEEHIKRLNRVLYAIRGINQLAVREGNPQRLLKESCKILTRTRDYLVAQAILSENDNPVFQTTAVQPRAEEKELTTAFPTQKIVPCAHKALKERATVIVGEEGTEPFCGDCPFPEKYTHGSSVALPLSYRDKVFGALAVCSDSLHAFDPDEVKLLEEVCGDIGFALESMKKGEERRKAEENLQRRVHELTTLSEVSTDISSTLELDRVLTIGLESALKLLDAEAGSIMLLDKKKERLTVAASHGLSKEFAHARERLGEGIAGYVAKSGEPLLLKEDMKDTRFERWRKERRIKDALSVPIKAEDRIVGTFNVNDKRKGTFTQSDLRLFTILASEMGVAIENAKLYRDVRQGLLNTVKALAVAVDAKDPYTWGHSERVARYSTSMAREMGLSKEEIEEIEIAAHLHDVGKIGVSEEILGKPVALTKEEWEVIKEHPKTSVKILEPVDFPSEVVSYVLSHHERPDGKGYPNRISKNEIPLGASIIQVADAFDAMTSERPYREALSEKEAISELKGNAGTQFQPEVVEAFLRAYERELKGQKGS